jgi:hypothetical protein
MEKIYTHGSDKLSNFFNEIGIGNHNQENSHLIASGNSNYLNGTAVTDAYFIDKDGLFDCAISPPFGYKNVSVEEFINSHRERLKQRKMDTITVTKKELEKIHNVACPDWKFKIESYANRNIFGNDVELTKKEVEEMFTASDKNQTKVLESIFGEQKKEIDLRSRNIINAKVDDIFVFGNSFMRTNESLIGLPRNEEDKNVFFLNDEYEWELVNSYLLKVSRKD